MTATNAQLPQITTLHINHLVESQDPVPSQYTIKTIWHAIRALCATRCGILRRVCDEHETGDFDRLDEGGDHVLC